MVDKTHPIYLCRENNIPRTNRDKRIAIKPQLSLKNSSFILLVLNNAGVVWLGKDKPIITPNTSLSITGTLHLKKADGFWYKDHGYYVFSFVEFINLFFILKNGEWNIRQDRIKYALGIEE